jgi:catechol 2,3-dioxygenase-like lactoylglutathione lyase family enzyme
MQTPFNHLTALLRPCVALTAALGFTTCDPAGTRAVPPAAPKINAGIVTPHLARSRDFYVQNFDFEVTFENEFYVLLRAPGNPASEIAFLLPDHPSQQPIFRSQFGGQGVFFTIEVTDVDAWYARAKKRGLPIEIELREEPWGDRHFAVVDPNGIGVDVVTHTPPES